MKMRTKTTNRRDLMRGRKRWMMRITKKKRRRSKTRDCSQTKKE